MRSLFQQHGLFVCILAAVSLAVFSLTLLAIRKSSSLMLDDGYYYLQIAWHIAQGHGSTFDGINASNGYHPLWQLMMVPLFWLGLDKQAAVSAAIMLQTLFFLLSGWMLYVLLYPSAGKRWGVAAACLWMLNPWLWNKVAVSGMETGVLVTILGGSCWLFMEVLENKRSPWLLGIALAFLTAARIDTLPFSLAIVLVLLVRKAYRPAMMTLLPVFVYLGSYLTLNYALFGHMLPVSGYIKSAAGREMLNRLIEFGDMRFFIHGWENLLEFVTLRNRIPPVAMILVPIVLVICLRLFKGQHRVFLAVCLLYALGFFGYYTFMYDSLISAYTYYFIPLLYLCMICLFFGMAQMENSKLRALVLGGTVTVAIAFSAVYLPSRLKLADFTQPIEQSPRYTIIEFINRELPSSAVVGCWDSGEIGYRANKPVVNLDGLVNSYEYQEMLQTEGLANYLTKAGITHLTNYDDEGRHLIETTLHWELLHETSSLMAPQATLFSRSTDAEASQQSHVYKYYLFARPSLSLVNPGSQPLR